MAGHEDKGWKTKNTQNFKIYEENKVTKSSQTTQYWEN